MSGGVPLSEELETKITEVLRVICIPFADMNVHADCGDNPSCDLNVGRTALRAFAREIQEPLEKKVDALKQNVSELSDQWAREENTVGLKDHPQEDCPSWYDCCHCTVDHLRRMYTLEEEARTALLASQESERALRQKLTSLESVDKQLTDARETAESLRTALESVQGTAEAAVAHCRMDIATLNKVDAIRHLAVIGLRAYRESGREKP